MSARNYAGGTPGALRTLPGVTKPVGNYFVLTQSVVTTVTLTGSFQIMYLYPQFLPDAVPVDRAAIEVVTLGTGVLRHGVYAHDPSTGQPALAAALADYGTVDITSTGVKESTIAVTLPAVHWYAQIWQGTNTTAPGLRANAVGAGFNGPMNLGNSAALMNAGRYGYQMNAVTGALPTPTPGLGTHQLSIPRVAYRRA